MFWLVSTEPSWGWDFQKVIVYNWQCFAEFEISYDHHHHYVPEGLGVFPLPWSSKWSWFLHLFFGRPMFLRPLVYIVVFVLVFCFCPSSVRVVATFSGTVLFPLLCSVLLFFSLIHWFFSLSNFVIPSKCLKNFICAPSARCSSLFFSTQTSLPNLNAALAVMLWILNFVLNFLKYY